MTIQYNAVPDRAATVVVHPTPGIGDATTIAEGLALLPAEGGMVLVREGTYPQSVTTSLPAAKPVTIRGCGNSSIVSLGANAIAAFTIPSGYTINTPIVFENFKVTGTEVANQAVVEYAAPNGLAEITIQDIQTTGVEKTVNVTNGSTSGSTPGQDDVRIHMLRCRIRPNATDTSVILSNPSPSAYPRCWMTEVEFIGDSLFAIPVGRTEPLWGRLASDDYFGDVYMDGCEISVGGAGAAGESDFAGFYAENSTIYNNDTGTTIVDFFTFGSFTSLAEGSSAVGCMFRGIGFQCIETMKFESCYLERTSLDLFGESTVVHGCSFYGTRPRTDWIVRIQNENMTIAQNRFDFNPGAAAGIDCEAPTIIIGNEFEAYRPGANGAVFVNNSTCVIIGNRFPFAPTSGPPLVDAQGSNYYYGNSRLFNSGTGGQIPPTMNPNQQNMIEGIKEWSGTGSLGAGGPSTIVDYRTIGGVTQTKGYIQNTGANNFTLTEVYDTQDLGSFSRVTTPFTPGSKKILDPFDFTGLALPADSFQVLRYRVQVTVIAGAAGWHVYFAAPGSVHTS